MSICKVIVRTYEDTTKTIRVTDKDEAVELKNLIELVRSNAIGVRVVDIEERHVIRIGNADMDVPAYVVKHIQDVTSNGQHVVPCIKFIREMTGAGLKEAKDFVDKIRSTLRRY